jgi:ribosomal protein S18 acetylase RimI-like enzyme
MPNSLDIRRLAARDLDDYRTIRLAALERAPDAFGSVYAEEVNRPIDVMRERLASSLVFGAYLDGRIVGMIGLKQEEGPKKRHKGFVWGFYVDPEGRRQGVGTGLITALIEAARPHIEQLTLTVVENNEAAIALYKRHGFTIFGVEPRAHKTSTGYVNQVLMVLLL